MIMSQTHIFNFFPGSVHNNWILKILSVFASRQKDTYLPNQQVWLNETKATPILLPLMQNEHSLNQ